MEPKDYINVRVRKHTQRKLRIVAALSQESMLDTLERLVAAELERLQNGGDARVLVQEDQDRSE